MVESFKDPRKREWLTLEGADKPPRSPILPEAFDRARRYRHERLHRAVAAADRTAILLYDASNMACATGVSNMQAWATHNLLRLALLFADGYIIDFQYRRAEHPALLPSTVDEARRGTSWFHSMAGDQRASRAAVGAAEWALVPTHPAFANADGRRLEVGTTVYVERYIGEPGDPEAVKLESQVLIMEAGPVRLDSFPFAGH